MNAPARLRELLRHPGTLMVPGAFDMVSARLVERAGFSAVYMTGFGQSASHLGLPDAGYISLPEMVERGRNMVQAVGIPVLADADTGYGNELNVRRTVELYEGAGLAGCHIEDQVAPKRCGHTLGRQVVPAEEMVRKIRAAVDARRDPNFLIIARTDARTGHGLAEALRRGRLYEDAGADSVFIESPETEEELAHAAKGLRIPVANMADFGRTPIVSAARLAEMGFKIAIYPITALLAAARAMERVLAGLRQHGTPVVFYPDLMPFKEMLEVVGFPQVWELEKRYAH
ncbi:MAG TPA: isocitrate lyase/PEP mutase family protein [Candidatus Acidoferrum sp.]|nr:isocitrate lyase/PEP mutase family protein [Candidatus Acidoferrum sp.]